MTLSPQAQVSEQERESGLRLLVVEAAFSNAVGVVTSLILTALAFLAGRPRSWPVAARASHLLRNGAIGSCAWNAWIQTWRRKNGSAG